MGVVEQITGKKKEGKKEGEKTGASTVDVCEENQVMGTLVRRLLIAF